MRAALADSEGDPDAILARLEAMGFFDAPDSPRLALAVFFGGKALGIMAEDLHRRWRAADDSPRHPLAPLVAAWLKT